MKRIQTMTTTTTTILDRNGDQIRRTTVEEYEYYPEKECIVDNGDGSWSYQPKRLRTDNNVKEERHYD